MNLNGHEDGNGGYCQGEPKVTAPMLYSTHLPSKNRRDGAVEATSEGGKEGVALVIEWCKKCPPIAEVKDTDVEWKDYKGEFSSFKIVY